jgi:hypothetical protein
MKTLIQCPKCEAVADEPKSACPSCGVVYEKLFNPSPLVAAAQQRAGAVAPEPSVAPPAASKPADQKKLGCGTIAVILVLLFMWLGRDADAPASKAPKETVYNSSYDGSVYQVERYLERNLKDPDSFEAIEWSSVVKRADGGFMVRCKYRAKNSFGGYVVENQAFILDSTGNVTQVMSLD